MAGSSQSRASGGEPSFVWRSAHKRSVLVIAVCAVSFGLVLADAMTPVELNVPIVYPFPLMLAGAARGRRLLWFLATLLIALTFIVYAWEAPGAEFRIYEAFFVNRVLAALTIVFTAGLLEVWQRSSETSEAQARQIKEQEARIEAARTAHRLVEVQDAERRGLANELHDLVAQNLTGLSIDLNIVKSQLPPSELGPISARLEDSLALVDATIESIRDVMNGLRSAVLDDYGLGAGLRSYAEHFSRRTGLATTVLERGTTRRLPCAAETAFFRIAQEALANVAKHAGASKAVMTLATTGPDFCLTIADDGRGFDPAVDRRPAQDHGWGMLIMSERAAAVGAQLKIEPVIGRGTNVIVTLKGAAS